MRGCIAGRENSFFFAQIRSILLSNMNVRRYAGWAYKKAASFKNFFTLFIDNIHELTPRNTGYFRANPFTHNHRQIRSVLSSTLRNTPKLLQTYEEFRDYFRYNSIAHLGKFYFNRMQVGRYLIIWYLIRILCLLKERAKFR